MKTNNALTMILATAASAALPVATLAALPEVSSVSMTQDTARLVTITYSLEDAPAVVTLDVQTNANTSAAADDPGWTSIGGKAVWNATGDVWRKVAPELTEGNSFNGTITWRPDLSWPDHKIADGGARAVVTAWALDNTPDYMVVDVSSAAEPNTQKYYPSADFVPHGVSNSLYKTTTLLMRKIMAKDVTWTMGSTMLETKRNAAYEGTHQVTLTNNYYIGVYEVTQSQWSEVATNSASAANFTTEQSMRPMEMVSYNEIRNTHNTKASAETVTAGTIAPDPSSDSFLGLLRLKTGLDFDLPSEAQWEFAARAGKGVGCWNDGSDIRNTDDDDNLDALGRYVTNPDSNSSGAVATIAPADGGTAIVGSYAPNSWGLYDMHGNVWEWCLDWFEANINPHGGKVNIDPVTPANTLSGVAGGSRVRRGGSWFDKAGASRPANRTGTSPIYRRNNFIGFRVLCSGGLR